MKYLFAHWDSFKKKLDNKYIILFLDYDGTLTPIVNSPAQAVIPVKIKELLSRLSQNPGCKLAIISGRALGDIKKMVGLENIIYAGNHGLELEGPKIRFQSPIRMRFKAFLKQIKNGLTKKLSSIKGVLIEDKGLSLSIHYRLVNKKKIALLKNILHKTIISYLARKRIKTKAGKMVLEITPPVKWDKGKVVLWLLARQRIFTAGKPFMPVYVGDDKTDEDAFKVLKDKGLAIFVGRPRKSHAGYYLKNTQETARFLKKILELNEK
ncbi:MAG: trehalose-phosphatase [Candidatus Omnitrophica bacterium]|nr:trehalose-phosphatase [Candidatus Omnitrophota bacterium]MCG2705930.1 trehalose-phosphatase [Candidatus Omnitrophota bacterium]